MQRLRTVRDEIGHHLGGQQQVEAVRIAGQIAQPGVGPLRPAELLDGDAQQVRVGGRRHRGRGLALGAEADLQPPQRHGVVPVVPAVPVDTGFPVRFQQPQHQLRLVDGEALAPAPQHLGQLVATRLERLVPNQCAHQRVRHRRVGEPGAHDRIGQLGDQIVEHRRGLPGHPQRRGHRHREFGQPGPLPGTADQPPARPPLSVGPMQVGHHATGPHPPIDPVGDVGEKAQVTGHRFDG